MKAFKTKEICLGHTRVNNRLLFMSIISIQTKYACCSKLSTNDFREWINEIGWCFENLESKMTSSRIDFTYKKKNPFD
jgi:hypothetical protein